MWMILGATCISTSWDAVDAEEEAACVDGGGVFARSRVSARRPARPTACNTPLPGTELTNGSNSDNTTKTPSTMLRQSGMELVSSMEVAVNRKPLLEHNTNVLYGQLLPKDNEIVVDDVRIVWDAQYVCELRMKCTLDP